MQHIPKVVGHRGWPTRFPDNTMAGFIAAGETADAIEVDVRRCSDGNLVLSHDPVIGDFVISDHPWSVLGEIDLGSGHKPTMLDELIGGLPGLPVQFEIKNLPFEPGYEPDHRVALETAERVRPADMITSFNWMSLAAVRQVFPEVRTGVLVAAFVDFETAIAECVTGGHIALLPSVSLPMTVITRGLDCGLEVFPWVVNDADLASELAGLGVSGMITDDPAVVRAAVGRIP